MTYFQVEDEAISIVKAVLSFTPILVTILLGTLLSFFTVMTLEWFGVADAKDVVGMITLSPFFLLSEVGVAGLFLWLMYKQK